MYREQEVESKPKSYHILSEIRQQVTKMFWAAEADSKAQNLNLKKLKKTVQEKTSFNLEVYILKVWKNEVCLLSVVTYSATCHHKLRYVKASQHLFCWV